MKEVNGKERKTNTHRENFDSERSFEGKESREEEEKRRDEVYYALGPESQFKGARNERVKCHLRRGVSTNGNIIRH